MFLSLTATPAPVTRTEYHLYVYSCGNDYGHRCGWSAALTFRSKSDCTNTLLGEISKIYPQSDYRWGTGYVLAKCFSKQVELKIEQ